MWVLWLTQSSTNKVEAREGREVVLVSVWMRLLFVEDVREFEKENAHFDMIAALHPHIPSVSYRLMKDRFLQSDR